MSNTPNFWQRDPRYRRVILTALTVLALFHVLVPLRHHLLPGDVAWTEEGHRYSWRMMLRGKSGYGSFKVNYREPGDTTLHTDRVQVRDSLKKKQYRKLWTHPDMVLQYAHHLRDSYRERGYEDIEVYADIRVKLNGRKRHPYIDPERDLAKEEWSYFWVSDWILPEGEND